MNEEHFFAWLDGELDPVESHRVAAEVAADPALLQRADAHRAMQAGLAAAFAPIARAPLPEHLIASVSPPTDNVVDFAAAREHRHALPSVMQWAAMAATLVVGIVGGSMLASPSAGPSSIATEGQTLVAGADLGIALDTRLASAPLMDGPRIGLTFRDHAGAICRSFHNGAAQGLACRDGEQWRIRALVQGQVVPSGDFRMAAGDDPVLAATVGSLMAGEPFDAAQEKAAKDARWR